MSGPISPWKARHRESNSLSCAVRLFSAILLAMACIAPLAYWWGGSDGLTYLALAGVINLAVALASLALMLFFIHQSRPLEGMLLAMGLRMGPLLALCVWLAMTPAATRNLLFISCLIFLYLVALASETYLSVKVAKVTLSP